MTRNEKLTHAGLMVLLALYVVFGLAIMSRGDSLDTSGWRASAVSTCQATVHPAVGRICSTSGSGHTYGSGTLIDKNAERGIVVTCSHLFRDGIDNVTVTFPDGKRYAAELLGRDKEWDLAALLIAPPDASPVAIAVDHPKQGDPLTSCGYGSNGQYWCNQGRVLGYVRTTLTQTYETLELSGRARDGDSGGPVFNASGELVAVLWGTDGRMVGGTYCGRVRKFLAGIFGSRPGPRSGPGANQGGGLCPRCGDPNCVNSQQPGCQGDGCCPPGGGGNQPLPGAIPIPKPGGIFPIVRPVVPPVESPAKPAQPGPQGKQGPAGEPGTSPGLDAVVEAIIVRLQTDHAFMAKVAGLVKVPPTFPDHGPITFQLLDKDGKVRIQNGKPAEYRAGYAREEDEVVQFQLVPVQKAK